MSDVLESIDGEKLGDQESCEEHKEEEEQRQLVKPKLQLPGSDAVRAYERRQQLQCKNATLLQLASLIFKKHTLNGQKGITRQRAIEIAKGVIEKR